MGSILVVDDDAGVRKLMVAAMQRAGHETLEAENGAECQRLLACHAVNLLITDLVMPEKEGLETIRALRKSGSKLKILAVSGGLAGIDLDLVKFAEMMGADAALAKPFTPVQLLETVNRLLASPA